MVSTVTFQIFSVFLLGFHATAAQSEDGFLRKVSTAEIINDLDASLSLLVGGHASSAATKRFAAIEASTWPTFQSLPKNTMGRLAPPAVRHIVHGYFAREHGWQMKGLEAHGMQANASNVHGMNILQDKAPVLVEGLLAARHQDNGLALDDIVAMIAVLEQLVFDESMTLLEAAYRLNGVSVAAHIDEAVLHRIVRSYLVLFGQGAQANLFNASHHHSVMARRPRQDLIDFEQNAVSNFDYASRHRINPFVPRRYSFEVVAEIATVLLQRYGKWQNAECIAMNAHMVELDPEVSGRVPLSLLYAQPQSASYHFLESAAYLRKIGALDESSSTPKVLINNYITGPSNCIASSSYFSVCCLSLCDSIMHDIEHDVLAPKASAERLLASVRNISNVQVLPNSLQKKLQDIADRHGGAIPIHGRLFAQWLHFAFPHECPFPSIVESAEDLKKSQWHSRLYLVSDDERATHLQAAHATTSSAGAVDVEELWSDHEVLHAHDEPQSPLGHSLAGVMRMVFQLAALCLILRSAYSAWKAAVGARDGKHDKVKKNDDLAPALGFQV